MINFNVTISIPVGSEIDKKFARVVIDYGENFSLGKQSNNICEYHFSFSNKEDLDGFINHANAKIPGLIK